eukprot:GILI01003555.1.p1 GENE.GILI01003555.1~~GILI01003555.1.p1  ORF type:complete len:265 (-),score=35.89 GILI01003555.1:472-1266(-)
MADEDLLDELDLGDDTPEEATPKAEEPKTSPKLTKTGTSNTGKGGYEVPTDFNSGKLEGTCAHCGLDMRNILGILTADGPVHNDCIPGYKRLHVERCVHCDCVLPPGKRSIVGGAKLHPECVADYKAKKPWVPPTRSGEMRKFSVGRSFFGGKNWQQRYFSLSKKDGLAYWEKKEFADAGQGPKGCAILDSRARLITHPTRQIHKEASNPSKHFIVIFFESASSKKEMMLLCECTTWEEHDEWTKVLQSYIKNVDDPKDVKELS